MKIKNGLIRYDFIEFLVRIAQLKYMSSDFAKVKVKTFTEALRNLIEINIRPVHPDKDISIESYWQKWRDLKLWNLECNDILDANLSSLHKVYDFYC